MHKLAILLTLMLTSALVHAQDQTIILKDGSVYEGFISRVNYKNGATEITYTRLTKQIPVDNIRGRRTEKRALESLPKEWQDWAVENNKVEVIGGKQYLPLTTMIVNNHSLDWYILVSGSKAVTAFTVANGTESIKASDIDVIRKEERCVTLLTDVDDIIQTDAITYCGVILEQRPGLSYTIWNREDKSVHEIDYSEIRSVGKSRYNQQMSIWSQTPYLERLRLNDRTTEPGLIIENEFGKKSGFLFAERIGDGMNIRQYTLTDAISLDRFRNPDYNPVYDIILGENESRINRDSILVDADVRFVFTSDSNKVFYVNPDKYESAVTHVKDANIIIETSLKDVSDVFLAAAKKLENVPLSIIHPEEGDETAKRSRKNSRKQEPVKTVDLITYNYASLFESSLKVSTSVSMNGITKLEFTLPEPGFYVIYLRWLNKCWVIDYSPESKK